MATGPRCCAGKNKYWPMRFARKKAQLASSKTGHKITAYQCPCCGFCHIGHSR